jgi:hypothetical protein
MSLLQIPEILAQSAIVDADARGAMASSLSDGTLTDPFEKASTH